LIFDNKGNFIVSDHFTIKYEDLKKIKNDNIVHLYGKLNINILNTLLSSLYDESSILIEKDNLSNYNLNFLLKNYEKNLLCLTTSGSTGIPKLIAHDKNQFLKKFNKKRKNYKTCVFMPWYHVGGLDTLLYAASNGSTCYIPDNYNPEYFLNFVKKNSIEVLALTPSYLKLIMLSKNFDTFLKSVKIITCGAEPFMESVLKIREYCPWIKIIQKYGTTETGALQSRTCEKNPEWISLDNNGSWKTVDNILFIKSDLSCKWSLDNGVITPTGDWKNTGDYVEIRDDGYIKILGRKNDVIIVGGRNVYPQEVRSKILEIENIKDARVYGKKNDILGQIVCADIVSYKDISKFDILKILKNNIDSYKLPVIINFCKEIKYTDRHKMEK
jgi:long-chain acyl-CoA synthetase